MDPTRRLWATAGLAVVLAGLALILADPLLLAGTAVVGAWLLSRQYLFFRATRDLTASLTVVQSPARRWLRTDESTVVTLRATLTTPSRFACTLRGGLPTAADPSAPLEVTLEAGEQTAERTTEVRWPVAGQHDFEQATLTVSDGLFEESFPVGTEPTVTVEPRGPRNVHVGEGGDRLAAAYGEHDAGRHGSGIEPAELRQYIPGDAVNQIDWNATARLGEPHVREFEAETDRKTHLVVDHRPALSVGPPEESKLSYLREVALAVIESARELGDPLGLLTVDDEGITARLAPATTQQQYTTARKHLLELDATTADRSDQPVTASLLQRAAVKTGSDIQQSLTELERGDGPFERTIRPFYADGKRYRERIRREPLYEGVRRTFAAERGPALTVLCTDDSAPAEVRETVKLARREGGSVLVLLAPTVLYEVGALADVERAYERYVEFEQFRRDLAGTDSVTALEVAPGDRLATVLATGRPARRTAGGGTG